MVRHFNGLWKNAKLSCFQPPTTPHLVGLPEPVVDPEEAQGPARGLVAFAAHGVGEAKANDGGAKTTATALVEPMRERLVLLSP